MKVNEILTSFTIYTNNEESALLDSLSNETILLSRFNEHDQEILNNLIRKSLVMKIVENGQVSIRKNAKPGTAQKTK